MSEAWSAIAVDGRRTLVYGPRFGRLYLLPSDAAQDERLQRILGLVGRARSGDLADPVERIARDLASLNGEAVPDLPRRLRLLHLVIRASRSVLPLRMSARMVRKIAIASPARGVSGRASASDIGRMVHAMERRAGAGDCYARALATAFLSLSAGRCCTLTVGVLAPTRKMHAWCGVGGELPYEPVPEHYLYQPLWTLSLSP